MKRDFIKLLRKRKYRLGNKISTSLASSNYQKSMKNFTLDSKILYIGNLLLYERDFPLRVVSRRSITTKRFPQ